jgi:hypothetical protein
MTISLIPQNLLSLSLSRYILLYTVNSGTDILLQLHLHWTHLQNQLPHEQEGWYLEAW